MRWPYRFIIGLLGLLLFVSTANAERRVALVIGNGAYKNVPKLSNPANDASDVAAVLAQAGFETIFETNLDQLGMQEASIHFAREARTADVALFYYSGHALQFGGVNYLVPVDADLRDEADLRRMARADQILADLQQAKNLRILVLDACRENPFAEDLKRSVGRGRGVDVARGLAKMDSPDGTIISYATQSGRTADDGTGRNSPYTGAFIKRIAEKETITAVFEHIGADVYELTKGTQVPELSLSYFGEYYLTGKVKEVAEPSSLAAPSDPCADAAQHWKSAESVGTIAAFEDHIHRFPTCAFAGLAKSRISVTTPKAGSPRSTIGAFDGVWVIKEFCDKQEMWPAATYQLVGKIDEGIFHFQVGEEGKAGSRFLHGRIEEDGSGEIDVVGVTTTFDDPLHRPLGAPFRHKIALKLDGSKGAGIRIGSRRPCRSEWSKLVADMGYTASANSGKSTSTADENRNRKVEKEKRSASRSIENRRSEANPSASQSRANLSCTKMLDHCRVVCVVNSGRSDCASTICVRLQQECLSTGCWRGRAFSSCGLVRQ